MRQKADSSFDRALREAIGARGLSLDRLHARLLDRGIRVSLASLSNWQRGRCRPERAQSLQAVHALEEILGLAHDELVTLLGPPRPRGRWLRHIPGSLPYQKVCPVPGTLDRLLRQVQYHTDGQLRCLAFHEDFQVGPDRDEQSVHTRAVFRARQAGVDRHVAIHYNEHGVLPRLTGIDGCRLGRMRSDPADGLTVVELLFDRPLGPDETYVVEYEFSYGSSGPPASYYQRWLRFPASQYLLQIHFDAAALPARCYRTWQANAGRPVEDPEELRLSSWHTVHIADSDIVPGVHGIRWEWD